jgi:alpha-tubulin suppressor-like RCC1 family protein
MSRPNQFLSPEGDIEDYFVDEYWLIDQWVGDTLWTWGNGGSGRLGDNTTTNRLTPVTTFAGGTNWKQISCGEYNTAAIKTDGTLWVWGDNTRGQLGINQFGNATHRTTPVTTFAGGTNWKQVSCGLEYTAAIKTDGTLWTWGYNYYGELGTNNGIWRSTPVTTFAGGTNWKQVFAAKNSSVVGAIKTDGTLWTWGRNSYGQLGNNTTTNRSTPVTTFAGGTNWKQVSIGNKSIAAIKTDGTLWTWGINQGGQLGDNTTIMRSTPVTTFAGGTNWKQVEIAGHTSAIKTDGTLWNWGWEPLATNDAISRSTPVTTFAGGTNWKQVACGGYNTAAIKTDGTLWVWGSNNSSKLGTNDNTPRRTPVTTFAGGTNWKQVSSAILHSAAITSGTDPTFFIA